MQKINFYVLSLLFLFCSSQSFTSYYDSLYPGGSIYPTEIRAQKAQREIYILTKITAKLAAKLATQQALERESTTIINIPDSDDDLILDHQKCKISKYALDLKK